MTQALYETVLLAIVLWREARSETVDTLRVVAWSIKNRVSHPAWWGGDWASVISKFEQYSSMTVRGDPNTVKWPLAGDAAWANCMSVAAEVHDPGGVDVSQGATHYYDSSVPPPQWTTQMVFVMAQGPFHFYRPVGLG